MEYQAIREGSQMGTTKDEPLLLGEGGRTSSQYGSQMSMLDNETIQLDKNIKELKNVYSDEIFYNMAKAFKKLIANPDPPSTIPGE